MDHLDYMREAIKLAKMAQSHDDVPVGAIVVYEGMIIGKGENRREVDSDPIAHAEIIAIHQASQHLDAWNLSGCSLYVTLEPCAMCAGAIVSSRIDKIYFGAFDGDMGCCGSINNIPSESSQNNNIEIIGGILHEECAQIIKDFFITVRKDKKPHKLY